MKRLLIFLFFISFNTLGQDFDYENSSMSIQICNKVQELSKGFTTDKDAINALKEHGLVVGLYYSIKRMLSCHPFGGQGHDPVPKKLIKDS